MKAKIPRIMFAGTNSGSGKTTITCAILKALINSGLKPTAFKCGPDYIDPMFHTEVIGTKSRNLDLFMLSEDVCKYLLVKNAAGSDVSVIEGVMGYYDGVGGNNTDFSSYHLSKVTKTPCVLIVNCEGASLSLAAIVKGFAEFKPDSNIRGVILNKLPKYLYKAYKEMIEKETGIQVVGFFPDVIECSIESRHLGLITAAEISDLQHKISVLAEQALKSIDINALIEIANKAEDIDYKEINIQKYCEVRIAVAKDKAFCFYYEDSLELLESMGAKIIYFSPLEDKVLPICDGLILGGGYPEIYAKSLSENKEMLNSIKSALSKKLPCIAECGGFMYLLKSITTKQEEVYNMVGVLGGNAYMTEKLSRFGYITLKSNCDSLLANIGEEILAHEFHYSDSTVNGNSYTAIKPISGKQWSCINASEFLHAGYPHIHLWGNINLAKKFIEKCEIHKKIHQ